MKHSPLDPAAGDTIRKTPPGPRGHWLLGSMPDFLNDSLGYLRRMAQDYGDVVRYRVAHMIGTRSTSPPASRASCRRTTATTARAR